MMPRHVNDRSRQTHAQGHVKDFIFLIYMLWNIVDHDDDVNSTKYDGRTTIEAKKYFFL